MTSPRNNGGNEAVNGNKEGGEIDREKVCPLLLRVFCATSRHNNLLDYNRGNDSFKSSLQVQPFLKPFYLPGKCLPILAGCVL